MLKKPPRAAGNKRWCCGDALHLDLSYVRPPYRRGCMLPFPVCYPALPLLSAGATGELGLVLTSSQLPPQAAFDAIAQRDRGVVDLKIRPADCGKWGQQIRYDADPSSGG